MYSTWLFYLTLIVIVHRGSVADDDFRPMTIPVNDWHERRPPSEPVAPARYWEDALRHSVYLTLVRDKIDQLIAKGDVIPPDAKPDQHTQKEVDDHDLWERIKSAPFDRIEYEEPALLGDVTIVAKGRLMEQKSGFRFAEDEPAREKCSDETCMQGVKALWSVKRVRQRDPESSGRYHYELTFSVTSQAPKKQKKPYENPVRTFTVRETDPQKVVDSPLEHRGYEPISVHPVRTQRTIWLHKNIVPQSRKINNGLERIFSTLFDDDEPPRYQRYRPMSYPPPYPQAHKQGYVGSPSDQQKRLTPYPYKPHTYKYSRPLPPPPYQHPQHFIDSNTFVPGAQSDRYVPNGPIRTTRPAVLPTPLDPVQQYSNWTTEPSVNSTESTTIADVSFQKPTFPKTRPVPMKINYLSDHVRPPVYNAPPGVFVTMDKKPFKPMPPLKLVHSKPLRYSRPTDFRPSPQLNLHTPEQYTNPDPMAESPFRPITYNLNETTTTERIQLAETSSYSLANNTRKPTSTTKGKKPPKKHDHIKAQKSTTAVPEIITAGSSEEENQAPQWVNVIGSFSKTTPMDTHKDHHNAAVEKRETTTTTTTTTTATTPIRKRTTTEAYVEPATTPKPKKRTRPPPAFTKPDKIKKHKRVTTTTTKAPQVKTQDLIPQASTAAAKPPPQNATVKAATTTTTTTTTSTTTRPTTTTKQTTKYTTKQPSTTEDSRPTSSTTQPKIKNRFRQSTLMVKGTSLKHDRWSITPSTVEASKPTIPTKFPKRKGSNFQGHGTTASPEEDFNIYGVQGASKLTAQTENFEETADQYDSLESNYNYDNQEETKDHSEYIFESSSTPSDTSNEISEQEDVITTEQTFSTPKNKTKCKKKKVSTTPISLSEETTTEPFTTTAEPTTSETASLSSTPSIFEELFGAFTLDDGIKKIESTTATPDQVEQESENNAEFVKLDDDLQDFLDSLEKGQKTIEDRSNDDIEYEEEEEEEGSEEASVAYEDTERSPRDTDYEYEQQRPFSLLELMAME